MLWLVVVAAESSTGEAARLYKRGNPGAYVNDHDVMLDSGCIGFGRTGGDDIDGVGDSSESCMRAVSTSYRVGWLGVSMLVVNLRKPIHSPFESHRCPLSNAMVVVQ